MAKGGRGERLLLPKEQAQQGGRGGGGRVGGVRRTVGAAAGEAVTMHNPTMLLQFPFLLRGNVFQIRYTPTCHSWWGNRYWCGKLDCDLIQKIN